MSKNKLGNLVIIKTGKLDANASSVKGEFPFFTCSKEPLKIDTYSYDCKCVLVAGNGDLNVKYYEGKFDAYQRTYIIESRDDSILDVRYLFWFLSKYVEKLRALSIGGVIKYIKLNNLTDPIIPLPPLETQKQIVKILDEADALRQKRKQAIALLDDYLKAVFLDMFGDPVTNPKKWEIKTLENIASIKIGPFGSLLHKADYIDNGIPLVNPKHIINNRISADSKTAITKSKHLELNSYHLHEGDVVLARRGEIGRCGLVTKKEHGYLCGTGSMFIRPKKSLSPVYLIFLITNPKITEILFNQAKGITMKNLNASSVKNISLPIPPIDVQEKFFKIVQKIEALKQAMQAQLAELDTQFQALMQKAFRNC